MTHSLTIEVPDQLYRTLVEKASKKGKEIEEIAVDRLSDEWPEDVIDPFDKFIGAFNSDIPDWGTRHDELLGEVYLKELRGENE